MEAPHKRLILPTAKFKYPITKRTDKRDNFFGVEVIDPYRWMENVTSPDVQKFLKAQKTLTDDYLGGYPHRDAIKNTFKKLFSYTKSYCPKRAGSKYLILKKEGLNDQEILYVQDDLDAPPRVFVDPNQLEADGSLALTSWEPSPNGETLVYLESHSGSDWKTARFKSISTEEMLPDVLHNIKFTRLSWTKDNLGLFYSCYPTAASANPSNYERNDFQELFYHHLGTNQTEDVLLVSFPVNPDYRSPAVVSSCGNFLVVTPQRSCANNLVYFLDLKQWIQDGRPRTPALNPVLEVWEAECQYLTTSGQHHYFITNKDAPNYCVVAIDLEAPDPPSWIQILPEKKRKVLEWCQIVQNYIFASYLTDVKSTLQVHSLEDGSLLQSFPLEIGSISYGSAAVDDENFFFMFVSYDTPGRVYRIDLQNSEADANNNTPMTTLGELPGKAAQNILCFKCAACRKPKLAGQFKVTIFSDTKFLHYTPLKLIMKQVWFPSKDGTQIPMFIAHCARIKPKLRPCLLRGYGAHGFIMKPNFRALYTVFMEHLDGIIAVVNARGGGEFGQRWFEGGSLFQKQHTFDDIQAAANYLIKRKYTNKSKLVIIGTSSGGLAAAACVNQRPDLFAGAIVDVGILDMMRFHKFTIGHNWISDYGSPENKMDALNLLLYSPYHNIAFPEEETVQYPAILVLTAEEDDRVVPWHSYKYTAELQAIIGKDQRQTKPLLLRVEPNAGHGYGKPTSKLIDEGTDMICFMSYAVKQKFNY